MKINKRLFQKIIIAIVFIMSLLLLGGCRQIKELSGTYVNELRSKEYFEFSGKSKVTYRNEDKKITGSYRISDGVLVCSFDSEDNPMMILEVEDEKTLYIGLTAYVKKGFWEKNWLKIVIFNIIFAVVYIVYKKVTGHNLEDDIEKWGEQFENFMEEEERGPKDQEMAETVMRYCGNCGNPIPKNAAFCSYCGEKTEDDSE